MPTRYRQGFAEVTPWNPPLPTAIPGEVMRVLVRHGAVEEIYRQERDEGGV